MTARMVSVLPRCPPRRPADRANPILLVISMRDGGRMRMRTHRRTKRRTRRVRCHAPEDAHWVIVCAGRD